MYLDQISITNTSAGATYGRCADGPVQIRSGSKKTRLDFLAAQDNQTLTDEKVSSVYVEKVGSGLWGLIKGFILSLMDRKFVKCTRNDKTIYINVNSLAKRLGISRQEIRSKESEEELDALIDDSHTSMLETQAKVDAQFQKMVSKQYVQDDVQLKTKNGDPIDSSDLHTALGLAAFWEFEADEIGLSLQNGKILHLQDNGGEWPAMTLFTERVIGKGGYGRVEVVQELSEGRVSVAKIAKGERGIEDAENEYHILGKVSGTGIQERPYGLFRFEVKNLKNTPIFQGYFASRYQNNLSAVLPKLKSQEKEDVMRQLLEGLVELEKHDICHGDIKMSNCLFKKTDAGKVVAVIGDFGGSTQSDRGVKYPRSGTKSYMCEADKAAYKQLVAAFRVTNATEENRAISEAAKKLLMRKDVYAMGIVLGKVMNGHIKYGGDIMRAKKIQALIARMTNSSWEERPSATEVLRQFNEIFPK